jgi:hypothetical protein
MQFQPSTTSANFREKPSPARRLMKNSASPSSRQRDYLVGEGDCTKPFARPYLRGGNSNNPLAPPVLIS